MLRNGKFVREDTFIRHAPYDTGKIKIGAFYTPGAGGRHVSVEERFMQDIVLGQPLPERPSVFGRLLGRLFSI